MASPNAKPTWATLHTDPALKDRQDKIVKILHSQMMNFKLYSPDKLETCVKKLIQLFDNILQSPDEEKYRKVEQMERYWIFDAAKGNHTWKYLQFAHQQLQSARSLIQQKVERHEKELEERKFGPKKERELLLKQLEADKASRKNKFRPIVSGPHTLDAASPSQTGEVTQSSASSPPSNIE